MPAKPIDPGYIEAQEHGPNGWQPVRITSPELRTPPQAASNNRIDDNIARFIDKEGMDTAIRAELDEVFAAHGISTVEAKREVLSRVYSVPKGPSDAELMQDLPTSLQPRPYRQKYDADTVRTAQQVVNRFKSGKAKGDTFDDDEQRRYRAACRIVGTTRQKDASPGM